MTSHTLKGFADEVLEIMPLMVREFAKREDNAVTQGKISCPQMVALHHVAEKGEVTVSDIARLLATQNSSASVLIERLVAQKMMKRRHDSRDRRVVWVSVTPGGRKAVADIMDQKRRSLKFIFGKLNVNEREQYLKVLRKVRTNLSKATVCLILASVVLIQSHEALAFSWPWSKPKTETKSVLEIEAQAKKGLNLELAYRMALKQSESLKITAEDMEQAQARFYRSIDYFLPNVRYKISRYEQDVSTDSGGAFDFSRRSQREQKFTFTQPIFSGFKEIAALQGTGADKKEQAMKYKRAKETLFIDVMAAFYAYINAEQNVTTLVTIHHLMADRIKDVRERADLGRSRESEWKITLSDQKVVEADLLEARKVARVTGNLLEFYIGEPLDGYQIVENNGEPADWMPDLTRWEERADVVQAEMAYVVAQKKVISANSNFFPSIYADGNIYTRREGFQDGNDWDVRVTIDVPVFEPGQTLGDVKEAASNREKAELAWERVKRLAASEVDNAMEEYEASQQRHEALDEAQRALFENYALLQLEFSQNLVNNLEVLDALRRYQDVRMRFNRAAFEAKMSYWRLWYALGDIPATLEGKDRK